MAGYAADYSMSNNARSAYGVGVVPASKLTASMLKAAGVGEPLVTVRALIKAGVIAPTEWHHTSARYNKTYFYDPADIAAQLSLIDVAGELASIHAAAPEGELAVEVTWVEWVGRSWKTAKPVERTSRAVLRGGWLFFEDGPKKKADGKNIKQIIEI